MGGLWYALNIIGIGMTYCVDKAVWDTMQQEKGGGASPPPPLDLFEILRS